MIALTSLGRYSYVPFWVAVARESNRTAVAGSEEICLGASSIVLSRDARISLDLSASARGLSRNPIALNFSSNSSREESGDFEVDMCVSMRESNSKCAKGTYSKSEVHKFNLKYYLIYPVIHINRPSIHCIYDNIPDIDSSDRPSCFNHICTANFEITAETNLATISIMLRKLDADGPLS